MGASAVCSAVVGLYEVISEESDAMLQESFEAWSPTTPRKATEGRHSFCACEDWRGDPTLGIKDSWQVS